MATETINIIVRENGARVVKRNLERIGDVAERSVRGLRLLQNSLFVIGGAGLLAGLGRMIDTVTNFQNRLSLLTRDTATAVRVQNELFDIARRTRVEFSTVAQTYTRTALATRALGISTQETLNFTESLQQAAILSGASVRETNASLIQLSQALASNRFSGDEFRSVAEQLPFIIDVIGNSLGVTRGEVRQLGIDGKLTAGVILKAFREAREEISDKFSRTIPTLTQSFVVFKNRLTEVVGNLNQVLGVGTGLSRALISIADNLESLVAGTITSAAAFAAFKFTAFIGGIINSIRASRELAVAVAQGNAVLLTSVGIEQAKAATQLQSATAAQALAAATVRQIQLDVTQLQTQRALLSQQQASIVIDSTKRRARNALTGQFIAFNAALSQNIRTNIALTRTETALATARGNLSRATATQTAAEAALATAQGRSAIAGAATSTFTTRLARAFPGLAAVTNVARVALAGLWAILAANPIGTTIAAIITIITALGFFSDKISIVGEEFVTLRDIIIATFQLISEAVAPVTNFISSAFLVSLDFVSGLWNRLKDFIGQVLVAILNAIKSVINFSIGLWVGMVNSTIKAWEILPVALKDLGAIAVNGLIDVIAKGVETIVRSIGNLLEFIGSAAEKVGLGNPFSGFLDGFSVDLDRFRPEITGAAREVGQIFNEEFEGALSTDFIGNVGTAILERARQVAAERMARMTADLNSSGISSAGAGDGKGKTFEQIIKELTLQNELLRVNSVEREKLQAILKVEKELKRELTDTERALVTVILNENQILTKAAEIYDEINDPALRYATTLKALNGLLSSGRINQEQFNKKILEARGELLETQTTLQAGFERGFLKILEKTGDFATQISEIITRSFDGMSSALADFVIDGKADFKSLVSSILRDLIRLQISGFASDFLGPLLSNAFKGSDLFAGFFANGGLIPVGQNGLVGEAGVERVFSTPGGTVVQSNSATQRNSESSKSSNVFVNIQVPPGSEIEESRRASGADEIVDIIVKRAGDTFGLRKPATRT